MEAQINSAESVEQTLVQAANVDVVFALEILRALIIWRSVHVCGASDATALASIDETVITKRNNPVGAKYFAWEAGQPDAARFMDEERCEAMRRAARRSGCRRPDGREWRLR